jgi:ketosteroid isomerase-like protein
MPTRQEYLTTYAQGWVNGDVEKILSAAAPDYVFDDPKAGMSTPSNFRERFAELKALRSAQPFMELSEVVVQDTPDVLTAWCLWRIPNGPAGSGLIKVDDAGVVSELICHYS